MGKADPLPIDERHGEFIRDESGLAGRAEGIFFPRCQEDIAAAADWASRRGLGLTIQGARTGLAGGAVPEGGVILNLSRLNGIGPVVRDKDGGFSITAEAGATLADVAAAIKKYDSRERLFWPPDPTEQSATIGGSAACHSRGVSAYHYGGVGDHIGGATLVRADGAVVELTPGDDGDGPPLAQAIGSEGAFGVLARLRLRLSPCPAERWGVAFFFTHEEQAAEFVQALRSRPGADPEALVVAVEFIDGASMRLLLTAKPATSALKSMPDFPANAGAIVYVEVHASLSDAAERLLAEVMDRAQLSGSDPDEAWAASGDHEVERLRAFRHALPEAANRHVVAMKRAVPEAIKLGTDMAAAGESFPDHLARYRAGLLAAELHGCVFGHAGENHLHVNILYRDAEEFRRGGELIREWARAIAAAGGGVVGEHGAGRLRRELEVDSDRQTLKARFDPGLLWNPAHNPENPACAR